MQVTLTTEGPGEISVYAQDIALTVRCVVQRVDARHWRLSAQDWKANAWHHQAVIDIYPAQGIALVHAGVFLERLRLATQTQPLLAACTACGWRGPQTAAGECYQCADPDAQRWDAARRVR